MIELEDNWSPEVVRAHIAYVSERIGAMDRLVPPVGSVARAFVRNHRRSIESGRPAELRGVIESAGILGATLDTRDSKSFLSDCRRVFNYRAFTDRDPPLWGAYALCAESKYSMCPYCHQSFAHTLVPDGAGRFRPTLDHHYDQAKYPYLALSIFNLVPSCYTCNSQLKGKKDFYAEPHLHPFEKGSGSVEFVFDVAKYIAGRVAGVGAYELVVRPLSAAGERSVETFALNRRFNINKSYMDSFIARAISYVSHNDARAALGVGVGFGLTEADVIGFDSGDYKNEMLGKIKLDLYSLILLR